MSSDEPARDTALSRSGLAQYFGVTPGPLFNQALTHSSYAHRTGRPDNRRLASLGHQVVRLSVAAILFREFPALDEGQMSRIRAAMISTKAAATVARSLGVGRHVRLGDVERKTRGWEKDSILAKALWGLFGVVHLESGYRLGKVSSLVRALFIERMDDLLPLALDWKTELQSLVSRLQLGEVHYRTEEYGPGHRRRYRAAVMVGGVTYGFGEDSSKKKAQCRAAEAAWRDLSICLPEAGGSAAGMVMMAA
ncbi:MAG TPA: ribonuclease III domain-containing protein [Spirillospora sp.]